MSASSRKVLAVTTTSVIERGTGIPEAFALRQNFPNPFNPSTSIRYDLPSAGMIRLSVYNMLGQEVAKLVNEMQPAGVYTVHFDASRLPSGVYLYRLASGSQLSTQKMIFMK